MTKDEARLSVAATDKSKAPTIKPDIAAIEMTIRIA